MCNQPSFPLRQHCEVSKQHNVGGKCHSHMQAGGKHSEVNLSNEITGLVQKPTKNEEHSLSVWEQSIEWAAAHCCEWACLIFLLMTHGM